MKKLLILLILASSFHLTAQENEAAKSYFASAKAQLEDMLSGKEKPEYEKAIFIIENAWYENRIDKNEFVKAIEANVKIIRDIIGVTNNSSFVKRQANYLLTQKQIEDEYKKALTNWAIYTIMTKTICNTESDGKTYIHYKYNYSHTDPMATDDWTNTQVIHLNNTKSGNCFALASMFKILSNRLNSEANLCTAPSHIYIRHADEKGTKYNVELGTRNFPGTGTISTITYSTDEAIQNNISQRELTPQQEIALCLVYLAKGYVHKFAVCDDPFILECAETALKYDNRNLNALLLKTEYLENKLTATKKSISILQSNMDFQVYQNLIADLYHLGYREMPLKMKNQIIRSYIKDKPQPKQTPTNPITSKGRYATVSWGMFDERHEVKQTEQIGNTMFNTETKKITAFVSTKELYNGYDFDPVVFAWNIDPMYAKHPGMSPYHFAVNNPIIFIDPDGNTEYYFNGNKVGSDGKQNNLIGIVRNKDVAKSIKAAMKENGKYELSGEMLRNGASNKEVLVIHYDVLEKSYEVLQTALNKGQFREFGTEMKKNGDHYDSDPVIEGPIVKGIEGETATVQTSGKGDVIIHSHPTGYNQNGRKAISGNADRPGPNDPTNMNNPQYEMYIIVGKSGDAVPEQSGDNYGVAERNNTINVYDQKTHQVDKAIGGFEAGQILDSYKGTKSYKK